MELTAAFSHAAAASDKELNSAMLNSTHPFLVHSTEPRHVAKGIFGALPPTTRNVVEIDSDNCLVVVSEECFWKTPTFFESSFAAIGFGLQPFGPKSLRLPETLSNPAWVHSGSTFRFPIWNRVLQDYAGSGHNCTAEACSEYGWACSGQRPCPPALPFGRDKAASEGIPKSVGLESLRRDEV